MSIRLMSAVWDSRCYEGGTLLVLLALADWANDDGMRIYPGLPQLAAKARLTVRQAQRALRRLKEDGVIVATDGAKGGRGRVTHYRLIIERVTKLHALDDGAERVTSTAQKGDMSHRERVTCETERVTFATAHIDNHQDPPIEPSIPTNARARAAGGGDERPPARKKYSDAFERFWAEIRKWPEFTTIWSKPSVWDAWQALGLAGELLEPGDMVAAAREYGRERTRLNAEAVKQRKTPQHTKHPANFLREKLFLGIHEALAERKASAGPPRRISIDAGHVERLRRAGISDDLIAAWFGDGQFEEGQFVTFRAATLVKADWIAQRFAAHLERAFGGPVVVTVKQERAA